MATSGGEEAAAAAAAAATAAATPPAPGAPVTEAEAEADTSPGWEVAVRPLLSASYSAFEMKELPQLVAAVIERYRRAGGGPGGRWEGREGRRVVPAWLDLHSETPCPCPPRTAPAPAPAPAVQAEPRSPLHDVPELAGVFLPPSMLVLEVS